MTEKIHPKGIRTFNKHEKAPDFVLGTMVITLNELIAFCKENADLLSEYKGEKQLKLQILKSKDGGLKAVVDTYKSEKSVANEPNDLPF